MHIFSQSSDEISSDKWSSSKRSSTVFLLLISLVWSCLYVWHPRPIGVLIFMILLAKLEIANRNCIPLSNSFFSSLLYIDGSAVKVILSRNTPLFHTSRYLTWMDGRRQFRISRIAPRVSKVEQTASEL